MQEIHRCESILFAVLLLGGFQLMLTVLELRAEAVENAKCV